MLLFVWAVMPLSQIEDVRFRQDALDRGLAPLAFASRCRDAFISQRLGDWCDAVLFLFDGRVPDEGACFELGYCYAKGKHCIGYKTDARSFIDGYDNVMLHGAPEVVLRSEDELQEFFGKL